MARWPQYPSIVAIMVLLSACGGGGDGGSSGGGVTGGSDNSNTGGNTGGGTTGGSGNTGGGTSTPGPPTGQQLQLNTTQIDFVSPSGGGTPNPVQLSGTVTGTPSAVYATVTYTNTSIAGVSTPEISGASATAWVFPRFPVQLQPGTYHDTITVRACPDAACTSEFAGSPATVNVTFRVGLDVAPASISVQAIEGAAPPAQPITASYYAGTGNWTAAVAYTSGSGWLTVPASGTSLPTTLSAVLGTPPPGSYAANITISATGAVTEVRTIPVTYVVKPLLQVGAITDFSVTNQQGASGQTRSLPVSSADPARNMAWSATIDADSTWLQAAAASGTTGGASTLQLSLNAAEVAKLRNGHYVAQVVITPSLSGISAATVPVALTVDRTQVATVAPYVEPAGHQAEVIIRGTRLDEGAIQGVRFGTTDATSFNLDGPTRIRAVHPALPAGRYPVTVIIAGLPVDSTAELVVQDATSYAAAGTAPAPIQFVQASEFDPERRACYMASSTQVAALRAGATGWTPQVSPATFTLIYGVVLSADGRELLVGDGNYIVHLDPVTLAETRRTRLSTTTNSFYVPNLARVDDGTVVFATQGNGWSYTPWTHADAMIIGSPTVVQSMQANRTGNKLVATYASNVSVYAIFDSMTLTKSLAFTATGLDTFSADRFGTRWAFTRLSSGEDTFVTDQAGAQIGRVPSFDANSAVMSEDGQKLVLSLEVSPLKYQTYDLSPLATGGTATLTGAVQTTADYNGKLYLTPQQDELVNCGGPHVSASAVP